MRDNQVDIVKAENKPEEYQEETLNQLKNEANSLRTDLKNNPMGKQNWSVLEIIRKLDEKSLILDPSYQRRGNMWEKSKKIEFIESLFLGIYIPPIYVVEVLVKDNLGMRKFNYEVVDGKQRLSAIYQFFKEDPEKKDGRRLVLSEPNLTYFSDLYGGMDLEQISEYDERHSLKNLQDFYSLGIDIFVIKASMPEKLKYDIFARLNQGVAPLSPDEIRRAVYHSKLITFVENQITNKYMNEEDYFKGTNKLFTRNQIKRYKDLGRFFRSIAFYINSNIETSSVENYKSRPKEMINNILDRFAREEISLEDEKIDKIMSKTIELLRIFDKNKDHIVDSSIKFLVDELLTMDQINEVVQSDEYALTLDKSVTTTSNVEKRLELMVGKYRDV